MHTLPFFLLEPKGKFTELSKLVCSREHCPWYKVLIAGISFLQNLLQFDFARYFANFVLDIPLFTSWQGYKTKQRQPKNFDVSLQRGKTLPDVRHCKELHLRAALS